MNDFEYTVIAAPLRSEKIKGAKTPTDRYAVTLTQTINRQAAAGWEYVRAETLPSEERSGLTGRTTVFHNLLVFRRPRAGANTLPVAEAVSATPEPAQAPSPAQSDALKPAITPRRDLGTEPEDAAKPRVFSEPMRPAEAETPPKVGPAS